MCLRATRCSLIVALVRPSFDKLGWWLRFIVICKIENEEFSTYIKVGFFRNVRLNHLERKECVGVSRKIKEKVQ